MNAISETGGVAFYVSGWEYPTFKPKGSRAEITETARMSPRHNIAELTQDEKKIETDKTRSGAIRPGSAKGEGSVSKHQPTWSVSIANLSGLGASQKKIKKKNRKLSQSPPASRCVLTTI